MKTGKGIKPAVYAVMAAAGLMLMTTPAYANNTQVNNLTITQVTLAGTLFYVTPPSSVGANWPNPGGCTNASNLVVDPTSANANLMVTMLYDAYVNGDTVSIIIGGTCTSNGNYTFPTIQQVILTKS